MVKKAFAAISATALVLLTLAIPTTVVVALWHLLTPKTVADLILFVLIAEVLWLFLAAIIAYGIELWLETHYEEDEEDEGDEGDEECE